MEIPMWDNSETLINYIRHTFITCDDTGVCETALKSPTSKEKPGALRVCSDGNLALKNKYAHASEEEESDTAGSHSPDIHADVGHRRRSETSKRLETLKQQRLAQSKIKTVQWKEPDCKVKPAVPSASNANPTVRRVILKDNFSEAITANETCSNPKQFRTSAVSKFLNTSPALQSNPFQEFGKFDGNQNVSVTSRTVHVFPLMAHDASARLKTLEISVVTTAKVSDFIGLICFHYTSRQLSPQLSTDLRRYSLFVAEETGDIDSDLPARSPHENVSRFHFPYLALVDQGAKSPYRDGAAQQKSQKYFVTVYGTNGEKYTLEFDSLDVTLLVVRDKALALRFANKPFTNYKILEYNLEKVNEPNVALPLDATVSSFGTAEFVLVRAYSARGDLTPGTPGDPTDSFSNLIQSRTYAVTMVQKFKRDVKVQLGISKDYLEFSPLHDHKANSSTSKLIRNLQRQASSSAEPPSTEVTKSVKFPLSKIGGAEHVEEKSGRKFFRIIHMHLGSNNSGGTPEWKSHQFEVDSQSADEIVRTINRLLDASLGNARQEFLKRTPRKTSFFKRIQFADLPSFGESTSGTTPQN